MKANANKIQNGAAKMSLTEAIYCIATHILLYSTAVHLIKIQLHFYKSYSNILLHNDVRLDQALNKHMHSFPRAPRDLLQSCTVMMRWGEDAVKTQGCSLQFKILMNYGSTTSRRLYGRTHGG